MKRTVEEQQAIVTILLRYWQEISAIEEEFALVIGQGDTRPRIDYFHDAIRAYTSQKPNTTMQKRLSIENLSYDVQCLRYIAGMPMASITHDAHDLSASTKLVKSEPGVLEQQKRIDRNTKDQLKTLYEQYGVLFASLLKNTAENDYLERTDELNHEVEEINQLITAIEKNAGTQEIINRIQHLSDESLKRDLLLIVPQIKGKGRGAMEALIAKLRAKTQKNDARIQGVDSAYHSYTTSQLAIYESAKDMLKKMAGQGMNLVGQFVEQSLRGTSAGRGR